MPTPSPKLGLALPSQPDDFSTADVRGNWEKIDAAPGTYVCTSTSRPSWGENQAGRQIFEVNTGVTRSWTGTTWCVYGYEPGDIKVSAKLAPSDGWLLCDGSLRNRSTYSHLFAAIGTAFNTGGEDSTNFRIPNLIGKTVIGRSPTGGAPYNVLGEALGSATSVISGANLPPHSHTMSHNHSIEHTHAAGVATYSGDHTHTGGIHYSGDHSHAISARQDPTGVLVTDGTARKNGGNAASAIISEVSGLHTHTMVINPSGGHQHVVIIPPHTGVSGTSSVDQTGNGPGASIGLPIMQPSLTLNHFIKI